MAGNGPALRRRRSLAGNVFFGSKARLDAKKGDDAFALHTGQW